MTFLERYKNGETTQVYSDIEKLGQVALSDKYVHEIEAVITETMRRVAHNLAVIYDELEQIDYNFKRKIRYSFEAPLTKPVSGADELLIRLEKQAAPFGFVPLSLKIFYKIVGACNFAWDYETKREISWKRSDPIQIVPLDCLLEQVEGEYWLEEITEALNFDETGFLELSADYLHKDNISGGPAYAMEITPKPSIDGKLLNEEHQTTFINYLRIVFENCGFGRATKIENTASFKSFCDKVRPKLKKI